ncbi:hypothetical protein CCB80_11805 [Armatimonadetes bacterium Uphvl-Ar1]|nr:hypothetical protein CCB80_11805 [Armatimonadetes bacterium Uphvl-Ar1]
MSEKHPLDQSHLGPYVMTEAEKRLVEEALVSLDRDGGVPFDEAVREIREDYLVWKKNRTKGA